ncbi:MAG: hypothetical protein JKY01_09085 [Pseudomonadales bacterium]|nr:hypothetical protein [Pseudomonadales bacterium]
MNFDKLIKNAAKTYKNGDADKIIGQASKTANRMFDELVPEQAKEHNLVKGLKDVAEKVIADQKSQNSENQFDDSLVQSIKQGLKGARKTAEHYANKIDNDDSGKASEQVSDLAGDFLGSAEKLGKSLFSKRRK